METAENTIEIPLPVEEAHRKWLAFTEQAARGPAAASGQVQEAVPTERLPGTGPDADKGTISFDAVGPGRTRVTMQLRYNAQALAEAGQDRDWIKRRIGMYLERYQEAAGLPRGA